MTDDKEFLDEIQKDFLTEAVDMIEQAESAFLQFEKDPQNVVIIEKIFQLFHSIKGASGSVEFKELSHFTHKVEDILVTLKSKEIVADSDIIDVLLQSNDTLKKYIELLKRDTTASYNTQEIIDKIDHLINSAASGPQDINQETEFKRIGETYYIEENMISENNLDNLERSPGGALTERDTLNGDGPNIALEKETPEQYIKVPLSKIDNLLNSFGEQAIYQSVLEHSRSNIITNEEVVCKTIDQLGKITYDLQQTAISLRMVVVRSLFSKMERLVRDTSKEVGKQIEFCSFGSETELDKSIIDELSNPIMHIVRNSCDHGIESAEQRKSLGKPAIAKITMRAHQRGGSFFLEIEDDGQGLDIEKIRQKAISKGYIKSDEEASDRKIIDLIFMNGLSTKEQTSNLSGRGVGMDVVNEMIKNLKGTCVVDSERGKGTSVTIQLPLSLSMFNGTLIRVGEQRYVLSNSDYRETISISNTSTSIRSVRERGRVIRIRDTVMPLISLKEYLVKSGANGIKKDVSSTKNEKREDSTLVLIATHNDKDYAFVIDELLSQERVVLKKLGPEVKSIKGVCGGTILGDGEVCLILNLPDIIGQVISPE